MNDRKMILRRDGVFLVHHLSSFPSIHYASSYSHIIILLIFFSVYVLQGYDGGVYLSTVCVSDFIRISMSREIHVFLFPATCMNLGYSFLE